MLTKRFFLSCLCVTVLCGLAGVSAQAQTGDLVTRCASFVESLGDKAVTAMADKSITRAQRVERFRTLFRTGFDIPTIARFALGRYWNGVTPAQQQEYLRQFEDLVVRSYAAHFDSYGGGTFKIVSSRADSDHDAFIDTSVKPLEGPAVNVEWRVRQRDNHLGIIDVVVEGVSMSVSERQEFSSAIQAKGGNFDAFLQALRDKNASFAAAQ